MPIISIDLWGTLIKSSPLFVEAKVKLTQKYFNVSEEIIIKAFSDTKGQLNAIIESIGWQPSQALIFTLLFSKLNPAIISFDFIDEYMKEYQTLAIKYSPYIYSEDTLQVLGEISTLGELVLASNTMFINGDSLTEIIKSLGIHHLFDQTLFSDWEGCSKPNERMYGNSNYHIGDNVITDYKGALQANSKPFLINSTPSNLKDAYNFIAQRK